MGAPKQKWTREEEAALRNGVEKYGPGKWRAILRDPTWSSCLASRSNVDLKDKWRNMSVTANGWGSREKARLALKRSKSIAKQSGRQLALSALNNGNMDVVLVTKPLTTVNPYLPSSNKRCISRLDKLILDAVSTLKEPNGSSKSAIATYIEENQYPPPNFRRMLSSKLKSLVISEKLVKIRQNYMISGSFRSDDEKASKSEKEEKHVTILSKNTSKKVVEEIGITVKSEVDAEVSKMRAMNAEAAAKAAAVAVAEAEAAIAAAEQAACEAAAAEVDAEAAEAIAEAAMMALANSRCHW